MRRWTAELYCPVTLLHLTKPEVVTKLCCGLRLALHMLIVHIISIWPEYRRYYVLYII